MNTRGTLLGSLDSHANLKGKLYAPTYVSAYELAKQEGFEGTEVEWLASLKGDDGKSAYDIARDLGFEGTEAEWVESLKGSDGKSAYDLAVENGFSGTLDEWLDALTSGTGSGLAYHQNLLGRDEENQHPIKAIADLQPTLAKKADWQGIPDVLTATREDIEESYNSWLRVVESE